MHHRQFLALSFSCFSVTLLGCASDPGSEGPTTESGGTGSSSGGVVGSGGTTGGNSSGGHSATGGQSTSSGGTASGTGGATPSGGRFSTGGTETSSGGAVATGGAVGTGGSLGSGGSEANASSGCGMTSQRPDPRQQQTIEIGGLTRYYLMYVPENYDPNEPLSLVFAIHGLNMNNVWAAHDSSGFQLIENTGDQAILVYPQGIAGNGQSNPPSSESQWGNADSNWGGPPPSANAARLAADLEYFDAMLDSVTQNYCVDTDRVFAMGFSQGGFMTNALGCERASTFRGLATFAGWGPLGTTPSCPDSEAAHAIIATQGDTDGTVTPQMGQATRDFWRDRAGCSTSTMPFGDGCQQYEGCDDDKPVVYCTHGGDHFVPGGTGPRAWEFFQALE